MAKSDISYVFKAQVYARNYRKIQISAKSTLNDLSEAILRAYQFDSDHLNAFFMDGKAWSHAAPYWSPHNEEEPSTDKVKLSSFDFKEKDKFLYLFDFGHEWRFAVTFIKEIDIATPKPIVLESKGDSPEQYD
ncbi:hypothetical protein AwWohl_08490 [Gammaproteobacteria bacterium]|nr:hypothetical protein AwWohl_08490 [Gammaproteobacteria bacterium]